MFLALNKMGLYWFRAIDAQGHLRQAHMPFAKPQDARLYFAEQKWALLSLRRVGFLSKRGMKKEVSLFFLQTAYALEAGHTLSHTIAILQNVHKGFFSKVLNTLYYQINQGLLLSQSLEIFPWIFSQSLIVLIKTGENTGRLPTVLKQGHLFLNQELKYQKSLRKSLSPLILNFFFLIFALIVLMNVLLPEIESFQREGRILPASTRILLSLKNSPWILLTSGGLLGSLFCMMGWFFYHYRCFGLLGVWRAKPHYYRFFSNLYILLKENVGLTFAIKTASESLSPLYLKKAMKNLYTHLHRGKDFLSIVQELPFLPPLYMHLLKAGQATGQPLPAFKALLDLLEDDLQSMRAQFLFWLSPIILLFVASCFWILMDGTILCLYRNIETLMD